MVEIQEVGPGRSIDSPGSVCIARRGRLTIELLVCNNFTHIVSRHVLSKWRWPRMQWNDVLLEAGLNIPDGIAVSPDGERLAISNHSTHEVLIYDRRARPDRCAAPHGRLSGACYPHGLRFAPDGKRLWVADAGSPFVVLYEDTAGDWSGPREPTATIAVLDEATYLHGRANPEEGGPKGLDLDASGDIIVFTNEQQPLAFFHAPTLAAAALRCRREKRLA